MPAGRSQHPPPTCSLTRSEPRPVRTRLIRASPIRAATVRERSSSHSNCNFELASYSSRQVHYRISLQFGQSKLRGIGFRTEIHEFDTRAIGNPQLVFRV